MKLKDLKKGQEFMFLGSTSEYKVCAVYTSSMNIRSLTTDILQKMDTEMMEKEVIKL